jgi:hypothetical protein
MSGEDYAECCTVLELSQTTILNQVLSQYQLVIVQYYCRRYCTYDKDLRGENSPSAITKPTLDPFGSFADYFDAPVDGRQT